MFKSIIYALFSFAFSVVLFLVWLFLLEKVPPIGVLVGAYVPWGIVAYYWWRTWKASRHERLVL